MYGLRLHDDVLTIIFNRDTKLYVYKSQAEPLPEGIYSLTGCILRDEGMKLGPRNRKTHERAKYHIFGLYLAGGDNRGPNSGVLLRMSSDSENVRRVVALYVIFCSAHPVGIYFDS